MVILWLCDHNFSYWYCCKIILSEIVICQCFIHAFVLYWKSARAPESFPGCKSILVNKEQEIELHYSRLSVPFTIWILLLMALVLVGCKSAEIPDPAELVIGLYVGTVLVISRNILKWPLWSKERYHPLRYLQSHHCHPITLHLSLQGRVVQTGKPLT